MLVPGLVELDSAAVHTPDHDGACGANDPPVDAVKHLLRLLVSAQTADGVLPVVLAREATMTCSSLDLLREFVDGGPGRSMMATKPVTHTYFWIVPAYY